MQLDDAEKKEVVMLYAVVLVTLLIVSGFPQPSRADIYVWTDESGVKHFTNYAPPPQAEVLMKTREVPYDEAKDRERMEADSLQAQQQQWLELEEKQAMLADEQQMAVRRVAEANRRAEDTLQQAQELLQEARQISEDDAYWQGNYFFYVPGYVHYYRGHYPYHRKPHSDGKYDHCSNASRWNGWDNGRKFSSRYDLRSFDTGRWQGRYTRPSGASVNESFRGNASTGSDSSDLSRASGRSGRSGFMGLRR
jgi:hypothetical protein